MHKKGLSLILGAALLASNQVQAAEKQIAKEKDWILSEVQGASQELTCIASTQEKIGKNVIRFEVSAKKAARAGLEFMIRVVGPESSHSGFALSPKDGSRRWILAPLSKDATTQFHWMIGQSTADVLTVMNAVKELDVISIGGAKELKQDFPMSGFVKIMEHLKSKCLNGAASVNGEFEQLFASAARGPVDPARLDQATVQYVRSIYFRAYDLFLQKQDNRAALAKLRQQYATELNEMESLTALITKLESRDIPKLVNDIASVENLRVQSERELVSIRSQIPGMEQALVRARATLDKAQQTIAPHVDEFNQRDGALDNAVNEQARAERRLSQVRAEIRNLQQEIESLRSEAQTLNYEIGRLEGELVSARRIHADAERQMRAYDRERVYRERLARDISYDRDVREARDKRSDLRAAEVELGRAQGDVNAREAELRSCQAVAGQDCSAQQNALNSAQAVLSTVRSRVQLVRSELSRLEDRVESTERRIRREVDGEYEILARRERDARSTMDSIESRLMSKERRESQILGSEIPMRQNEINSLSNEQASLERAIPQWRAEVARLSAELDAFKRRVSWDQKKAALDAAQSDFELKTNTLNAARAKEASLVRTIANCQVEKPRLEQELAAARTLLANSKARQAIVRKSLEPFESERVKLDTSDAAFLAQIQAMSRDFESRLPR